MDNSDNVKATEVEKLISKPEATSTPDIPTEVSSIAKPVIPHPAVRPNFKHRGRSGGGKWPVNQNKSNFVNPAVPVSSQQNQTLSFIPLGGTGDVTRNMYLYEYRD